MDDARAPAVSPPQDLFSELAELGNLLYCMLAGPRVSVRRWPVYYLVYVELGRVRREVSRTTGYLSRGFVSQGGMVDHAAVDACNGCMTRLDGHFRAIADLLVHIEHHRLVDYGTPELQRIVSHHFSQESRWYPAGRKHYRSGFVAADGRVLRRVCVPLDTHPWTAPDESGGVVVVRHQTFHLEPEQSRMLLTRTARQVQTKLGQVHSALGA